MCMYPSVSYKIVIFTDNQIKLHKMTTYYFHIKNSSRLKYAIEDSFYSIKGNIVIANPYSARVLAEKINIVRKAEGRTDLVTAGQVNALGLLHEILHFVINEYEQKENPGVISRGINELKAKFGDDLDNILLEFIKEFPPLDVYKNKITPEEYLIGAAENKTNKEIILQEIILLSISNSNPASNKLKELYDDNDLSKRSKYKELVKETEKFFNKEVPLKAENLPLFSFLRRPILNSPDSLENQLDYILKFWGIYISGKLGEKILTGKDLILEDAKLYIGHWGGEKATPPVPVYEFDKDYFQRLKEKLEAGGLLSDEERNYYYVETEQFTQDIEWMPKVVMLAKNAFVWLHQLSLKYQREITKLDQIPDEELDNLQRWSFTSLWLIGLWERSNASKKIKQYMGNPEAAASAYSLFDYVIANDLGGESAFLNLKHRAWQRGIRISSDMVPNHTGIFSKWVIEKPDYFIQSSHPPYPNYQFWGPDLSDDSRVEIRIEDKYYSRQDAAVVFQRRDPYTGDLKYIYHGNDGTVMPWNDTAQLNLLNPEVRESLIQTIIHVARKTPIIRFDAAMTLTKKHYQRLWFPQPGTGGAIPSRSDYAMTREQFDQAMPVEFWREVVDRINKELPNTLLLAEAFWLMEGYFVRTLGMHRVYNSAFMHMMMKEENEKYRLLIRNTLEFNPEILKRYVNFMSNPDEETSVNQFGKGDKYFGVAVMMVTTPGLPMFAHGQLEGYAEKYGMEYQRAYYNETPDQHLIWRHETEIFPLTARRYIFSQVYNYELYDFCDDFSNVNENVFAYSNNVDGQRSLIVYNNSYSEARGTIKFSVAKMQGSRELTRRSIADALDIKYSQQHFYIYRDNRANLEYIMPGNEIHEFGLYFFLWGYQYYAFIDFREVFDNTGTYYNIYRFLNGRGVPSIEYTINELHLSGVHQAFREMSTPEHIIIIEQAFNGVKEVPELNERIENSLNKVIDELNHIKKLPFDNKAILTSISNEIKASRSLFVKTNGDGVGNLVIKNFPEQDAQLRSLVLLYTFFLKNLGHYEINDLPGKGNLYERMMVDKILLETFERTGKVISDTGDYVRLVKALSENRFSETETALKNGTSEYLKYVSDSIESVHYINLHEYAGIRYFNKEKFESYTEWHKLLSAVEIIKKDMMLKKEAVNVTKPVSKSTGKAGGKVVGKSAGETPGKKSKSPASMSSVTTVINYFDSIKSASEKSEYKFDEMKKLLTPEPVKPDATRTVKKAPAKKSSKKIEEKKDENKKKR